MKPILKILFYRDIEIDEHVMKTEMQMKIQMIWFSWTSIKWHHYKFIHLSVSTQVIL